MSSTASAASALSSLTGISSSAANLVSSYNSAQKTFNTQFSSTMSDLKSSAAAVKSMSYNFSDSDITTASDGTKTYSDSLKSAIGSIKSLVSDYNDALDLTSDYSSVGARMKSLNKSFADTTYRADVYQKMGISVDAASGKLSVDEDKLATALVEHGDRVQTALGSTGLAGKAEEHSDFALSQQSNVFPSMKNMLGSQLTTAAAYTNPKVLTASVQASMVGNLFDSML